MVETEEGLAVELSLYIPLSMVYRKPIFYYIMNGDSLARLFSLTEHRVADCCDIRPFIRDHVRCRIRLAPGSLDVFDEWIRIKKYLKRPGPGYCSWDNSIYLSVEAELLPDGSLAKDVETYGTVTLSGKIYFRPCD